MKKSEGMTFFILLWIAMFCRGTSASGSSSCNTTLDFQEDSIEEPLGPWSQILEDWTLSRNSDNPTRQTKAMKYVDRDITVSYRVAPGMPNKRDVSETDLYLLGAIEKLVYRVDYLEKRLRRAEELLYYVISGNNKANGACPTNYTRLGRNCYHLSMREFDWKSSASFCRGMGGNLVEFETPEEKQDVLSYLQTAKDRAIMGQSFWTGGLNPGLLWIWAGSARPVHQDTKQTVNGDGRCLMLDYNPASRLYSYKGEDCGTRQRYICELTRDDEAANKIERTARRLLKPEDS